MPTRYPRFRTDMTSSNEQVVNVENDFTAASYLGRLCNFTMPQAAAGAIIHPNNAPPQASDANNDKNNNKNNKGCMRLYPISDIPKQKPKKPVWLLRRTCAIMDDQNSPACGEEGCDTKAHALWKPEEDFDDDNEDDASSTTCRFLCMDCQMRVMFGFSEVEPVPLVAAPLRKPYPNEIERLKREREKILEEQQRKRKQVRLEQQSRIEEEEDVGAKNTIHHVANGAEMGAADTEDINRNGMQQAEESDECETTPFFEQAGGMEGGDGADIISFHASFVVPIYNWHTEISFFVYFYMNICSIIDNRGAA